MSDIKVAEVKTDTIKNQAGTTAMTVNTSGHVNLNKNVIEQWLLDAADASTSAGTLTPWARDTRNRIASRNTGITQSSGIFTFPHNGIYKAVLTVNGYGGTFNFIGGSIDISTNSGASFTAHKLSYSNTGGSGQHYTVTVQAIFDVIASNFRLRTRTVGNTASIRGAQSGEHTSTSLIFEQLG